MDDDKKQIESQKALIASMEKLLMLYMGKNYQITGLLSHETRFSLSINGPFARKELEALSRRILLDAELLGDGVINVNDSPEWVLEEIRTITRTKCDN